MCGLSPARVRRVRGAATLRRRRPIALSAHPPPPHTHTTLLCLGFFRCDPNVRVGRPKTLAEITNLISSFPKVKAVGVGHSWWQEQFCAGTNDNAIDVVLTDIPSVLYMYSQKPGQYQVPPDAPPLGYGKKDLPWSLDEASQTVTVLAGVGVRTLLDWLNQCTHGASPVGWTLEAFPWYTDQTIGGAVATSTHGSSLKYGSLSQQVTAIQLALADGSLRTFTPADGYLFYAAITSVGRLGIVTQLTLKVTPSVPVRRTTVKVTYDSMTADVTAVQNAYVAAMAASGNNPNDPAVVAALAPVSGFGVDGWGREEKGRRWREGVREAEAAEG